MMVALVAMVCGLMASPAFASSHGAAPNTGLWDRMVFEWEHFWIHMDKTGAMIGYALSGNVPMAQLEMASQVQCAGATPLASVLFTNPLLAVVTYLATMLAPFALLYALWLGRQGLARAGNRGLVFARDLFSYRRRTLAFG